MKAFLINPAKLTIEEVDYDGDYRSISRLIGARLFDAARFNALGDAVFVDDEGLLTGTTYFFEIDGYGQPLAGSGLVLGSDAQGETTAPAVTRDWLLTHVTFLRFIGLVINGRPVMESINAGHAHELLKGTGRQAHTAAADAVNPVRTIPAADAPSIAPASSPTRH